MKYKNYIFDCGNVLFSFSQRKLLDIYLEKEEDKEKLGSILYRYWEVQDVYVSSEDYYEFCKNRLSKHLHEACYNIIFHWDLWISKFQDIEDLIRKLKATGHKLYVISNMTSVFTKDHSKLPILEECFDGLIFSYEHKIAKPDTRIFDLLVNKYDLNKEECIFIDDSLDNCKGSLEAGIKSYLFDKEKTL